MLSENTHIVSIMQVSGLVRCLIRDEAILVATI